MQKKDWYIILGVFIFSFLLIQLSRWVFSVSLGGESVMLGPFGFVVSEEIRLSSFVEYKKMLTSTFFGVFFLFLFFVLNLILAQRLMGLRVSLTLFTVGVLSESLNSIFYENTLNWLVVYGRHFNLSDLYIVAGVISMIYICVKDRLIIFRKNNLRKKMFVDKDQYTFCFYMLFSYFIFLFGMGMFFLVFIKIVLEYFVQTSQTVHNGLTSVALLSFSLLSICSLITITYFLIYVSNKIYGPVYAFKKYVRDHFLSEGAEEDRPFKLRKGDHFGDLQDLAGQLKAKYGKNQ